MQGLFIGEFTFITKNICCGITGSQSLLNVDLSSNEFGMFNEENNLQENKKNISVNK